MVVAEMDTLKRVSNKGLGMAKYVFKTKKDLNKTDHLVPVLHRKTNFENINYKSPLRNCH